VIAGIWGSGYLSSVRREGNTLRRGASDRTMTIRRVAELMGSGSTTGDDGIGKGIGWSSVGECGTTGNLNGGDVGTRYHAGVINEKTMLVNTPGGSGHIIACPGRQCGGKGKQTGASRGEAELVSGIVCERYLTSEPHDGTPDGVGCQGDLWCTGERCFWNDWGVCWFGCR